MDSMPIRRCRICQNPLSMYNHANVCFCHKEHPDLALNGALNPKTPDVVMRGMSGIDFVWMQECGADPELRHVMWLEWKRRLLH